MPSSSVPLSVRTGRCPLPRWNSEILAQLRDLDIRHNPQSRLISNLIAKKDQFELISSLAKQDAAIFPQISTVEPHQPQTTQRHVWRYTVTERASSRTHCDTSSIVHNHQVVFILWRLEVEQSIASSSKLLFVSSAEYSDFREQTGSALQRLGYKLSLALVQIIVSEEEGRVPIALIYQVTQFQV